MQLTISLTKNANATRFLKSSQLSCWITRFVVRLDMSVFSCFSLVGKISINELLLNKYVANTFSVIRYSNLCHVFIQFSFSFLFVSLSLL